MGAQISAPLLLTTPTVYEAGTRHKPLLLKLQGCDSCVLDIGILPRYGALNTFTCSWRNFMYPIASKRTEAVSVLPYGDTSCWRATIRSPNFSFFSLEEIDISALSRFGVRDVRLVLCSREIGLLLCCSIFPSIASTHQKVIAILLCFLSTLKDRLIRNTITT